MERAFFVDRDGVINRMVIYESGWDSPQKAEDVKLVSGIEKVISWANENKISVIEVSNQPGVAKGKMTQTVSDNIESQVHKLLSKKGAVINNVYICPHYPDAMVPELKKVCDCRKPKPGLIFQASSELGLDLSGSIMLGDKSSDAEAAQNAGVKSILYLHNEDQADKNAEARLSKANFKVVSMSEVIPIIESFFKLR